MTSDATFDRMIGAVVGNYKIDRLLASDEFGPIFGARDAEGESYRLRILPVRPPTDGPAAETYLARFQQQAEHLALLRHPQILPLIDFGLYRGSPFLVWPHQPLRSLSGLLAESGPLDPVSTGRYLSQIADALDYAHRHETLHRNLSTDCVFLHLNGQLVIADFGVRRIFELTASDDQLAALVGASDASAPEQVVGGKVYLYTDIYALGALTFRLLTGAPMFSGRTREDVAQQHVYSQTPSLRARRPGLPGGLEAIIARAVAKSPDQRFQHATAFARAYADVLALAAGAPERYDAENGAGGDVEVGAREAAGVATRPTSNHSLPSASRSAGASQPAGALHTPSRQMIGRVAATIVILLVLAGGGVFILKGNGAPAGVTRPGATVTFFDSGTGQAGGATGSTDSAKVVAQGLAAPAAGSAYHAWLINTKSEAIISLGALVAQGDTYSVSFAPTVNGTHAANLLTEGNEVEITLEQGSVDVPVGHVVLSGSFPPKTFVHIGHLLVSFPTSTNPNAPGLLVSSLTEAQGLDQVADVLKAGFDAHDNTKVTCAAQAVLDIIEGQQGEDYHPLDTSCAGHGVTNVGDGHALAGAKAVGYISYGQGESYLDSASAHAALAGGQPDADSYIKLRVRDAVEALTNANRALGVVRADALALLNNPTDSTRASDLVSHADIAYLGTGNGSGTSTSGLPDALSGGVLVAYEEAQLMATLTLS